MVKNDYSFLFCYERNISRSVFPANSNVFSFTGEISSKAKEWSNTVGSKFSLSLSPSLSLCLSTYMYIQTIHDFQIGLRTPSRSEDVRGPRLCHVTSVPPCPLVLLRTYSTPVTRDQLAFSLSLTLCLFSLSIFLVLYPRLWICPSHSLLYFYLKFLFFMSLSVSHVMIEHVIHVPTFYSLCFCALSPCFQYVVPTSAWRSPSWHSLWRRCWLWWPLSRLILLSQRYIFI